MKFSVIKHVFIVLAYEKIFLLKNPFVTCASFLKCNLFKSCNFTKSMGMLCLVIRQRKYLQGKFGGGDGLQRRRKWMNPFSFSMIHPFEEVFADFNRLNQRRIENDEVWALWDVIRV